MLSLILSFVASWIPGIGKTLVDGYKAKLTATNTSETIHADLASRELAVQTRELELQTQLRIAQIGHWYEPEHVASYIFVVYIGKVVVWDVMLGLGSTPAIHGDVGTWLGWIAAFLFGKRGLE